MGEAVRLDIVSQAGLNIPKGRHGPGVECLDFGFLNATVRERGMSLALDPELVEIAAIPGLAIPGEAVFRFGKLCLKLVEHDVEMLLISSLCENPLAGFGHDVRAMKRVGLIPRGALMGFLGDCIQGSAYPGTRENEGTQYSFHEAHCACPP